MPDFSIEQALGYRFIAGVDEAGRGPLAGPVVASAVVFREAAGLPGIFAKIDDSKKLSASRREELYGAIMEHGCVGIGTASVEEIDRHNILQATFLAMNRAIDSLGIRPDMAIIDGNRVPKGCAVPARAVVKGDAKSVSIAAASIIAKVYRDRIMRDLDKAYPQYCWASNAGYGVKAHLEAIDKYGACEHHRRTFAPIKQLGLVY